MNKRICDRCGKDLETPMYIKLWGGGSFDLCDDCQNRFIQWINKKGFPKHPDRIDPMTLDPDEQDLYNAGYSDGWKRAMFYNSNGGTRDNY